MRHSAETTVLVATTNAGKIREIRHLLDMSGLRLLTLADVAPIAEPAETGRTFAANAAIKARAYAAASGLPTVAEDSGLEIDALGGRPGVESARYPGATYADKFANLYRELAGHPRPWTARFVCALAFLGAGAPWSSSASASARDASLETAGGAALATRPLTFTAEGRVEGEIAPAPSGRHGFGYDPIFFFPPYGCTFGDVTNDRKLVVAHRGEAFRQFREWLTVTLG